MDPRQSDANPQHWFHHETNRITTETSYWRTLYRVVYSLESRLALCLDPDLVDDADLRVLILAHLLLHRLPGYALLQAIN